MQSKVVLWAGGEEEGRIFLPFFSFSEPGGWIESRDASSFLLHKARKKKKLCSPHFEQSKKIKKERPDKDEEGKGRRTREEGGGRMKKRG